MAEPHFFGPPECPLFGVYDAPQTSVDREVAVVICSPFGREYILAHRALRQLALRLARVGFHVLRFDYRGCGDSAGVPEDWDIEAWTDDVEAAAERLLDQTGLNRVAFVGLRLGATLGLKAAGRRRDVEALVLWEPTLDGPALLADLVSASEAERRRKAIDPGPPRSDDVLDVFGFPLGPALRRSLESLALTFERRPARRLLLLRNAEWAEDAVVVSQLESLGAVVDATAIDPVRLWLDDDEAAISRVLVPSKILQAIVDWLSGLIK